jgi:hypothetical protein
MPRGRRRRRGEERERKANPAHGYRAAVSRAGAAAAPRRA